MFKKYALISFLLSVFMVSLPVLSQNLVTGGDMEDESAWEIFSWADPAAPEYQFGYTEATPKFGRGGCLNIFQDETAGQLLFWQRITLIAGETYRATAALAALSYYGGTGGGAWYQMYIDPEDVDIGATDYNPGAIKFFNMDGWQADFPEIFDDMWESTQLGGGMPEAPYYTAPGTPGEEVEVTFGIKFGQYWPDYAGTGFELLVDEVGLYHVGSAVNQGGDMEDESAWEIFSWADPAAPEYQFGHTEATPKFGRGGCLNIFQDEMAGQLLFWQRINLVAGETYRVTGAIAATDYYGSTGGGAWYQLYIDPEDVDIGATDYNPGAIKFFNMDGWQAEFPDIFDNLWESENLGAGMPEAPYYTAPGTPGEIVEITFGPKFGQYWPDYAGTGFELLVDELYIFPMTEAGVISSVKAGDLPSEFGLTQNYPNPFNPSTEIQYTLNHDGEIRLTVYDLLGQEIAILEEGYRSRGAYRVAFDGSGLSSGIYFYKLNAGDQQVVRKMILTK